MNGKPPNEGPAVARVVEDAEERNRRYWRIWMLLGAGWLSTNIGYKIYDLPLKHLLKDGLGLSATALALFFTIGNGSNYIKPLAAVCTDAIPIFGTRRRHYLLISLAVCGLMWLALSFVPHHYVPLLATYGLMYISVVFISCTLGGLMAEAGETFNASGRLSAQRIGVFRVVGLIGGPVGGWLANKAFGFTCAAVAATHFVLLPLFYFKLKEPRSAQVDFKALKEVGLQARALADSRTLWAAAGLVVLVMAAPGFGTPLYYYQLNTLHFSQETLGWLTLVAAACGTLGAFAFHLYCGKVSLRVLLVLGILTHVCAALFFLGYRSLFTAYLITGLYEAAQTMAVLPLYDLAIRATPKGSEALGYSIMMSAWNLTNALSDVMGSWLFDHHTVSFVTLILLNAGTTALVLLVVPFLPRSLTDRRDGEAAIELEAEAAVAVGAIPVVEN